MVDIPVYASDALVIVSVVSNGQRNFDFNFLAMQIDDLRAFYTSPAGAVTDFLPTADFTATGLEQPNGGTIRISTFWTVAGGSVTIYRQSLIERLSDYQVDLFAATINREMDHVYMIMQEGRRDTDRAVKVRYDEDPQTLPVPSPGKAIGWSAGGNLANLTVLNSGDVVAGAFGEDLIGADTLGEALDLLDPVRNDPIVIAFFGDSRIKGGNALVGTAGLSSAVTGTSVWNPDTDAWRDAMTLGLEPYDTVLGNNNIGRSIARKLKQKTGRAVYVVHYGVAGSNIWQWLDPDASHGLGSDAYWPEFQTRATDAFASFELSSIGKSTFDAVFVSLGANNGAADRKDFATYVRAMATQIRGATMPGARSDLPLIWLGMQDAGQNGTLHNQTINDLRSTIDHYSIIPLEMVSNVGDNVHEDSAGMELIGPAAYKAFNSTEITSGNAYQGLRTSTWQGGAAGESAASPWDPPGGMRGQCFNIRTATADAYLRLDAARWRQDDTVMVRNNSTGGGVFYVQPANGQVMEWPGRPGFTVAGAPGGIAGVPIYPGESCEWQKVTETEWEINRFTAARQPFIAMVGDATGNKTDASGNVLLEWVLQANLGISAPASGEVEILIPGIYEVNVNLWIVNPTAGWISLDKYDAAGAAWAVVASAGNGNATVTSARTIAMNKIVRCNNRGDKFRLLAASADVVWSSTAAFSHWSVRRLQGIE